MHRRLVVKITTTSVRCWR